MRLLNLSVVVSLLAVVAPTLTLAAPVDIIDTNPSTHGTDSDSTHSDTYSHALNYAFAVSGRSEHSDRSDPADASDPSSFDTSSLSTRGISLTGPFAGKKPQPTDVRQYDDENCSFLATLIAMSMTDTSYLMSVFTQDRSTGRWVVVFPNSQCHPVTVSKMGRTADINAQVDTW
jgi:hypothetical protein